MVYRQFSILILTIISLSFSSYGKCSTSKPSFDKLALHSSFIGLVELNSITFVSDQCGFLISGKVLLSYKGNKSQIQFMVKHRSDFSNVGKKHFLMAYKGKVENKCSKTLLSAHSSTQTLFPFYEENDKYFLVSRQSFLSTYSGNHYVQDTNIDYFTVLHNRIYALAKWDSLENKLK